MKENSLGTENIKKLLIKLSIPGIIGMVVNSLYNLVDTFFVAKGSGLLGLGALGIAFPIQMTLMAVGLAIGVGGGSILSRALGSKEYDKAKKTVANVLILITVLNISIALLGNLFIDELLLLFGSTETILPHAREYLSVILFFNLVFGYVLGFNNLVRAEGQAKVAMICMLIGVVTNIILDPIFILDWGLGMGIKGAAIATGIGQLLSFVYLVYFLITKETILKISFKDISVDFKIMKEIIYIGSPTFVRNFANSFVAIIINNILRHYGGDVALGVYGTINKVMMFLFMPAFGVIQGMQPIIGFNFGAKKYGRVLEVLKLTLRTLLIYFVIVIVLVLLFPEMVLGLFTTEASFVNLGSKALKIMVVAVPLVTFQIVASSNFQAIGKPKESMIISLSRRIYLFVPILLIMTYFFKMDGVWYTFPITDILASTIGFYYLKRERLNLKKLNEKAEFQN